MHDTCHTLGKSAEEIPVASLSLTYSQSLPPPSLSDLDSLLTTLRSLGRAEGREAQEREDGSGLQLLEQMLQSNTFKRAQKV